ncbi:MAG: monofunctional biosynthetic peptidoglycan transglycosylase [Deltaproteobacteria bacterium]|nr:monofunctional biosynthetic peptidoglycan transglycosylase [Deltaproteobacteria bacterium]
MKKFTAAILLLFITYLGWEYFNLPSGAEYRTANPTDWSMREIRRLEGKGGEQYWIDLNDISHEVLRAVLVAEDYRFFRHAGVDWRAVKMALTNAWHEGKINFGASTITQQLAKNLYLSESKNPMRKLKEIIIAGRLERELGKRRILELYVNLIEFGEGTFGVEAAARKFFKKGAGELSTREAATLAAVIPNPHSTYNLLQNRAEVDKRAETLQKRMLYLRPERFLFERREVLTPPQIAPAR